MPSKGKSFKPGGARLQASQKKQQQRQQDQRRGSSSKRGYGYRWQKYRRTFLNLNPLCKHCYDNGIIKQSTVVDHIKPHKGDDELFWDSSNHQALCSSCHSVKTASEDGGFGNEVKK